MADVSKATSPASLDQEDHKSEDTGIEAHKNSAQKDMEVEEDLTLNQEAMEGLVEENLREKESGCMEHDQPYQGTDGIEGPKRGEPILVQAAAGDYYLSQEVISLSKEQPFKETGTGNTTFDQPYQNMFVEGCQNNSQISAKAVEESCNENQEEMDTSAEQFVKEMSPTDSKKEDQQPVHADIAGDTNDAGNTVDDGGDIMPQEYTMEPPTEKDLTEAVTIASKQYKPTKVTSIEGPEIDLQNTTVVKEDLDLDNEEIKSTTRELLEKQDHPYRNSRAREFKVHDEFEGPGINAEHTKVEGSDRHMHQEKMKVPTKQYIKESGYSYEKQDQPCLDTGFNGPDSHAEQSKKKESDHNMYQEPREAPSKQYDCDTGLSHVMSYESWVHVEHEGPGSLAEHTKEEGSVYNTHREPMNAPAKRNVCDTGHSYKKQEQPCIHTRFQKPNRNVQATGNPNVYQEAKESPKNSSFLEIGSSRDSAQENCSKFLTDTKPYQPGNIWKSISSVTSKFYVDSTDANLRQQYPKRHGKVVTYQDLKQTVPTPFQLCRLKLKPKTKTKINSEIDLIQEAKASMEDMFHQSSKEYLDQEVEPDMEVLERNEKLLDEIFDMIEQRIHHLRMQVKTEFRTLTLRQQETVLAFWEAAEEFLAIVLEWLSKIFTVVLEKIRQGYTIEKDVIRKAFNKVANVIKEVF